MFAQTTEIPPDKVLLVQVCLVGDELGDVEEFRGLVNATDVTIVGEVTVNVRVPDARFLIGKGKAQDIAELVEERKPDVVIANVELSPSQERSLEKLLQCRVIDRTRLILDIFALRAQSHEGKLQVELAQLGYLSTRLVRGWTHLERQKGGIGLRGPGETQLETDRRLVSVRVQQLRRQLKKVSSRRNLSARSRRVSQTAIVALAGYTNAGKTSLFNLLCKDTQYVANQLFASLDTTLRRMALPGVPNAVLVDTVGFVQKLPHQLVSAFASTLDEVLQAKLVVQVVDANDTMVNEKIQAVDGVLADIGAQDLQRLLVWNKCDLLPDKGESLPKQMPIQDALVPCVRISVQTEQGIDDLKDTIASLLSANRRECWITLDPAHASSNIAVLHTMGAVKEESYDKHGGMCLRVTADMDIVSRLPGVREIQADRVGSK